MMNRDEKLKKAVEQTMEENKELLEKLKDYDENNVPYWDQQIHD